MIPRDKHLLLTKYKIIFLCLVCGVLAVFYRFPTINLYQLYLNTKTRYWIISYLSCLRFHFPYKSLVFTPNPGHDTPRSPFSSPNVLIFTPESFSGYIPVSSVSSIQYGGCCVCKAHCAKLVGGVDYIG